MIKKFRSEEREECMREWRALTLLMEYAPGLAPRPYGADLEAVNPEIVMPRLPGDPLRGEPLTDRQLKALAAALNELYAAVPMEALAGIPVRLRQQQGLINQIHDWVQLIPRNVSGEVRQSLHGGLE
ncbi:hypothetical protein ABZ348_30690 [Streptomyces sp. NPDC005963]|uniref:hypothetical protein n=1 Tax=Streptomyces sp. NPDC005963 TaxID=3156721 RepID=UPI0033C63FBA